MVLYGIDPVTIYAAAIRPPLIETLRIFSLNLQISIALLRKELNTAIIL